MGQNCQATIDDYEHPTFRASMQRITNPGRKKCSRKGVVKLDTGRGVLCLCRTHERLAREGFVREDGEVTSKNEIADIRRQQKHARNPWQFSAPHKWAKAARVDFPEGVEVEHEHTGDRGKVIDRPHAPHMPVVPDVVWVVWAGVEDDAFHENAKPVHVGSLKKVTEATL